jgi:hypothetical protein
VLAFEIESNTSLLHIIHQIEGYACYKRTLEAYQCNKGIPQSGKRLFMLRSPNVSMVVTQGKCTSISSVIFQQLQPGW